MTLGIECLLTDDPGRADELAQTLDGINRERREHRGRHARAGRCAIAETRCLTQATSRRLRSACSTPTSMKAWWASWPRRIKDKLHRPTFVFAASAAPGKEHELKGSGRSIPGFHLRDALDLVAKRHPGVLLRFGGHAMAAGCTIAEEHLDTFEQGLNEVAQEWLDAATLTRRTGNRRPAGARVPPRGSGGHAAARRCGARALPPPPSAKRWRCVSQRLVGEKHLALKLKHQGQPVDGIWFGHTEPLPRHVHAGLPAGRRRLERRAPGALPGRGGASGTSGRTRRAHLIQIKAGSARRKPGAAFGGHTGSTGPVAVRIFSRPKEISMSREVVVVSAVRTAIGTFGGSLKDIGAH